MDERQNQIEHAAKQAQNANAHSSDQKADVPTVTIGRRAGDPPPPLGVPSRRASDHEAAALAAPAKQPEVKKPVEVKVDAPAPAIMPPVAVHVTPPSDTKEPTIVHLPSPKPETPAVTVHIQPAPKPRMDGVAATPSRSDVAALHDKIDDLTHATHSVGRLAVTAIAASKPVTPWYVRLAYVVIAGGALYAFAVNWEVIKHLFG